MKVCTCCLKEKSLDLFSWSDKKNGYRKSKCKDCISKQEKEQKPWKLRKRYKTQRAEKKYKTKYEYHINYTYNLSLEDYNNFLKNQNNKCKICNKEDNLVVDHCHKTGIVRGLLCQQCNKGLGMLGDTKESLEKAYKYLLSF